MKQNEKPEKVKVSAFLASAEATLISIGTGVRGVSATGKPSHLTHLRVQLMALWVWNKPYLQGLASGDSIQTHVDS